MDVAVDFTGPRWTPVASRAGAAPLVMADNAVTRRANYNLLCRRGLINAGGRWRNLFATLCGWYGMGWDHIGWAGLGWFLGWDASWVMCLEGSGLVWSGPVYMRVPIQARPTGHFGIACCLR